MLFGVYGNFGVVVLGVWKLGILAHTKLSVCISGLRETSWLLCVRWNLERVRWWFHVVRWLVFLSFISAFRGTRWLLWWYWNLGFKICLHIPLGWWGAFGMGA